MSVECKIREGGFVFSNGNGKSVGPLLDIEEMAAGDIAKRLQVQPKEVLDAKDRAIQAEIEKEISWEDLASVLEITVKRDTPTKLIIFCAMLLAQTKDDQVNVGLQAESSTGKSYIPLEMSEYFVASEVITIASASPTAFVHEQGQWDQERRVLVVDLEGKILIFLDQPHFQLLERLRPLLSHDKKELIYKITDKSEKKGLRTKTVIVRGFPVVIFCTVKMDPDEQEKTRLFLLSPSVDAVKFEESIRLIALRKCDPESFNKLLQTNLQRRLLQDRISAIRNTNVKQIQILNAEELVSRYRDKHRQLKPRDQRDFPRIISLIKAHALFNAFNRKKIDNESIVATETDINAGFALYEEVATPNELGLPPYVWEVYQKTFIPLFKTTEEGVNRRDIEEKFFLVYHKPLVDNFFRKYLIPALRSAGLLTEEPDPDDKRKTLYYPTVSATISEPEK